MQQMNVPRPKRDPAPSRVAYRIHRLWLTPLFRALMRVGVPAFMVALVVGLYVSDEENRDAINGMVHDMRVAIETRDEFMVKLMAIDGASPIVAEDIRETLSQDFPISSFDLDLEQMKAQIETLDAVKSARLRIQSGGVLQVNVTERVPAVVWQSPEALTLLDNTGARIIAIGDRSERSDLPLIAGSGADAKVGEALELLTTAEPLLPRIRGLVRVGERRWDVVLDRNQRILLPADDPNLAMARVITLNDAQEMLSRDLAVVDMRIAHRPTIRLQQDAAAELRRIRVFEMGVTQE
ncbi:cell division protein FtsQ/DivIB [Pseudaestuariivita rosea]|uniref:cell division protein FtsQ/DivIB n=1 Tax=Pseudaestuariivita rosea TaxID=2763263 RepID=UPI001ABBC62B|nr:cell division protein FtsQ/DivIB [Pseudaestuariivita rosea]